MSKLWNDYRFEYVPVNEPKFEYNPINKSKNGIQPYNIETIKVDAGDVILLHLSDDCDIDSANTIMKEMKKVFPNNTIIFANEYILQGLTIIKPPIGQVNIMSNINDEYIQLMKKVDMEFTI